MPNLAILHGDCLEQLQRLPDGCVNLIVTSPPYGKQRKATYGGVEPDQYVAWFLPRAAEFKRVLHPQGSFVLNIKEHTENGERHTYVLELVLALRGQSWCWIEEYIWRKTTSFPGKWKLRFRDGWERLLHFALSTDIVIYQNAVKRPIGDWIKRESVRKEKGREMPKTGSGHDVSRGAAVNRYRARSTASGDGRGFRTNDDAWAGKALVLPDNVIEANTSASSGHPAIFPPAIPEFFIKLFTVPGDVVLDPFAGSGTTLFTAYEMDRHSIGVEIAPEYVEHMQQRKAGLTKRMAL